MVEIKQLDWDKPLKSIPRIEPGTLAGAYIDGILATRVVYYGSAADMKVFVGIPLQPPLLQGDHLTVTALAHLKVLNSANPTKDFRAQFRSKVDEIASTFDPFGMRMKDIVSKLVELISFYYPELTTIAKGQNTKMTWKVLSTQKVDANFMIGDEDSHITLTPVTPLSSELQRKTALRVNYATFAGMMDVLQLRNLTEIEYLRLDSVANPMIKDQGVIDLTPFVANFVSLLNNSPFTVSKVVKNVVGERLKYTLIKDAIFSAVRDELDPNLLYKNLTFGISHNIDQNVAQFHINNDIFRFQTSGFYRPSVGGKELRAFIYCPKGEEPQGFGLYDINLTPPKTKPEYQPVSPYFELYGVDVDGLEIKGAYNHESAQFSRITGMVFSANKDTKVLDIQYMHPNFIGWHKEKERHAPSEYKLEYVAMKTALLSLIEEDFFDSWLYNFITHESAFSGNLYPFHARITNTIGLNGETQSKITVDEPEEESELENHGMLQGVVP